MIRAFIIEDYIGSLEILFRIKQAILDEIQPGGDEEVSAYQKADIMLYLEMKNLLKELKEQIEEERSSNDASN